MRPLLEILAWFSKPYQLLICAFFFILSSEVQAQPANNNCTTAQPIIIPAGGTVCISSSTLNATSSNTTNACNTTVVNEVWFTYVAAGPNNTVTITPNGGTPIQQAVVTLSSAGCASTTYNACNAATSANGAATASWAYAAGTQINISVGGIMAAGTFQICITSNTPPPTPGSNCGGATPMCNNSPFSVASTAGNPSSGIAPACFNIGGIPQLVQNDSWIVFSVGQTGTLAFTATLTGAAEYDWALYNITNGCPGTLVSCNYFYSNGNSNAVGLRTPAGGEFNAPVNVTAGNTYAIMLDNYSNNGVGFNFTWGGTFQMAPTTNFSVVNPTGCNSLSTTFTNTSVGAATYNWNFGNGQTSALQNPPAQNYTTPGTYLVTLTGTSGAGCSNSYSASVQVFPNPTVNLAVTDESCAGSCNGQLLGSASGTGPFTYAWTGLSGSSNTQSSLCAANYSVNVTDQSNGCSATGNATVGSGGAVANATITPAGPFCLNAAPVTLSAVDGGGTWSGTGITNAATGTFNPTAAGAGTWTITYTIAGPCGDVKTTTITVNPVPNPTITAAGPFCTSGAPVNLLAASPGGTWSGTGITNTNTGIFSPTVAGAGSWTVTYTIAGACGSSDTEVIIVNAQQDATITPVGPFCSSSSPVTLSAVSSGGTWSGTGITNAAAGTFSPSVAGSGNWTITYTIGGACGDVQTTMISVSNVTFTNSSVNVDCFGNSSGQISIANATGVPPLQYSIDGGASFQATGSFSNLAAGTYSLMVRDANGCSSSSVPVTITQPTALSVSVSMSQQSSCGNPNGQATATALGGTVSGSYQYLWNTVPSQSTATATGLSPTNYTVTVTDDNGCTNSNSIQISSTPGFTSSIASSTDALCNGACTGSATAVVSPSAVLPVSFSWNDPLNQSTATAVALCDGSYQVTVTDFVGCISTSSVTIAEPAAVQAVISASLSTVCIGQSSDLNAAISGGTPPYSSYQWTALPPDPSLNSTVQNPSVSPLVNTTYGFVANDANGCPSSPGSVSVNVASPLALTVAFPVGGNASICAGQSASIGLTATGGDGNYSFFQLPNLSTPVSVPISVQPLATTTYNFAVMDGCGTPSANASSIITVNPLPQLSFSGDDLSGCYPHTVNFSAQSVPSSTSWNWNFGDPNSPNNTSSFQNPSHQFSGTGSFDVSVTAQTANGCGSTLVLTDHIEVFYPPVASFEFNPHRTHILNPTIDFEDLTVGNIAIWEWDFGDGGTSNDQNPTHTYLDTGNHVITLHVMSADGCESIARNNVFLDPARTLYIPNTFTPDRDHINDGFRAYGEGYDWNTYQMTIYDRWGTEIFRTNDITTEWDATYKSKKIEAGLYAWRILVADHNGRVYPFSGSVTIIH